MLLRAPYRLVFSLCVLGTSAVHAADRHTCDGLNEAYYNRQQILAGLEREGAARQATVAAYVERAVSIDKHVEAYTSVLADQKKIVSQLNLNQSQILELQVVIDNIKALLKEHINDLNAWKAALKIIDTKLQQKQLPLFPLEGNSDNLWTRIKNYWNSERPVTAKDIEKVARQRSALQLLHNLIDDSGKLLASETLTRLTQARSEQYYESILSLLAQSIGRLTTMVEKTNADKELVENQIKAAIAARDANQVGISETKAVVEDIYRKLCR